MLQRNEQHDGNDARQPFNRRANPPGDVSCQLRNRHVQFSLSSVQAFRHGDSPGSNINQRNHGNHHHEKTRLPEQGFRL